MPKRLTRKHPTHKTKRKKQNPLQQPRETAKFNDNIFGALSSNVQLICQELPDSAGSAPMEPQVTINGIQEGTDYTNRVGRNITMKSLYVQAKLYISRDPSTATAGRPEALTQIVGMTENLSTGVYSGTNYLHSAADIARLLIVYDKQTNNLGCKLQDILYAGYVNGGTPGFCQIDSTSMVNLNYKDRFKIIMDKRIPLTTIGGPDSIQYIKKFIRIGLPTVYSGNTNTITSIATGGLYAFFWSEYGMVRGAMRIRLRFTDA